MVTTKKIENVLKELNTKLSNIESILNAVNAVSLINVREFCHVQPTTALIGNGIEHGLNFNFLKIIYFSSIH